MKKMHIFRGLLMLTCLLPALPGQAQYNQTFTDDAQQSVDIVDATDAAGTPFSCMLATSSNYPIILHKRDFTGAATPSLDFGYSFINTGVQIDPTQLLFTPNEEYIVVGSIWHSNTSIRNPFAARFDMSGNMIWMYEYSPNTVGSSIGKVSICRVEDDPTESYIMVTGNNGPNNSPGIFDESICALKINAAGIQMWSYRYYPPATPIAPGTSFITDHPETILYVHPTDGGSDKYYIGGTTVMVQGGWSFRNGFCMSIDRNGVIVDPYQQLPVYGMRNQRAIFDAATNQVVIAYTCTNSFIATTSASLIGISRFSGIGLTMVQSDFYAHASGTESAGVGIREDRSGNYVVACEVYHSNPAAPPSGCAAMLKINKSTPNPPLFFKEYNYQTPSGNTNIVTLYDGIQENYVMGVSRKSVPLGARGISTTNAGITCGDLNIPSIYANAVVVPKSGLYTRVSNPSPQTAMHASPTPLTTTTDCDPANPYVYRLSGKPGGDPQSSMEETVVSVYPTLLSSESEINIEVFTAEADNLDINIYTMDGRIISTQRSNSAPGNNILKAEVAALSSGSYLVGIRTLSGKINKMVRISKIQ